MSGRTGGEDGDETILAVGIFSLCDGHNYAIIVFTRGRSEKLCH